MSTRRFLGVMLALVTVWAVMAGTIGSSGIALAATWSPMTSGTTGDLVDIWGSSSSNVVALTARGSLIHFDGNKWGLLDPGPLASVDDEYMPHAHGIWGTSASNLWVVGYVSGPEGGGSSVFRFNGGSWTTSTFGPGDTYYQDIWGSSASDVFVPVVDGHIVHYNGGEWSGMDGTTTASLGHIWGTSSSDVFAAGAAWEDGSSTIIHYDGSEWSPMTSGMGDVPGGIWGSSSSNVFVVGGAGTILRYNGSSWSPMSSGTTKNLNAVWGSSSSNVFAVGDEGAVVHYNGSSWSPMSSGTTKDLNAVWGTGPGGFFAAGEDGTILYYDDYPDQPINISPADGATGVSLTPTLQASAYADADGDAHIAARWQVRNSNGNYNSPAWDSGTSAVATSAMVPAGELANSNTYFWRVGYEQAGGRWSGYSRETSFTTIGATAIPPVVATVAASGVSSTSATLNLSLSSLGSASSVQASFEWGPGTAYGNTTTPQTMTGTGSTSYPLSGLSPATTYYFRARAVGASTSYGSDLTFTTTSTPVAPPTVATNAATGTAMDSTTLNGALTGRGSAASVQAFFEWGVTASYGNSTPAMAMATTGDFSADLTGLTAGTTYHYRAKAVGDDTAYGNDMTFQTSATPTTPPSVTTADADSVTVSSARLNGVLTSLGTASSVTVSFVWGTTQGGPYANETAGAVLAAAGAFKFDLSGPASGTTFYYQAKAVGNGASYGAEKSFTTAATAGGAPVIGSLVADNGRPGDDLTVTITGSKLAGATALSFGAGITINDFRVVSDAEITTKITIGSGAEAGHRDVTVVTPQGTGTALGGFAVNSSESRVHLWVYLVAVAGGLVGLGALTALGVWLKRRLAR